MARIDEQVYNLVLASGKSAAAIARLAAVARPTLNALRDGKPVRIHSLVRVARALGYYIVQLDGELMLKPLPRLEKALFESLGPREYAKRTYAVSHE